MLDAANAWVQGFLSSVGAAVFVPIIMNFDMASEMLEMDDVEVRSIVGADDVLSGSNVSTRRGVAGIFFMLDCLIPFEEALEVSAARGEALLDAWAECAEVAQRSAEETANLVPKVGRARPAAERSLGTPDAGAVSMALCIKAVLPQGQTR